MAIIFDNVSYNYEKKKDLNSLALKNIDLTMSSNSEFIVIIGKTGAGKTTLLSHINGLLLPTEGNVKIDEMVLTNKKRKNPKLKPLRKKIGYVFQFPEYQLFDETVLKDMAYGPKNFGYSDEEATKMAIDASIKLDIKHLLNKSPFDLSGGQMRKVAIGGILAYNPDVYLLDEPTRGLDPKGASDVMEFFSNLNKKENKTIIMITHDMDLLYKYATRVIVLDYGKVAYDGKKEEFFKEKYLEFGFDKPKILKAIDEINKLGKYNLTYENYNIDDLLYHLRGGKN